MFIVTSSPGQGPRDKVPSETNPVTGSHDKSPRDEVALATKVPVNRTPRQRALRQGPRGTVTPSLRRAYHDKVLVARIPVKRSQRHRPRVTTSP